jgi:hypothetical protein
MSVLIIDPGLRIESFAVINLRGVSTNKTIIYFIAMQTYKELIIHFISLTPHARKHDFSHILPSCLLFIAESRKYHPVVVLLHNHKGLKNISTKFHQVVRQCSVLYLRYCVLRYFVKLPPF